MPNLPVAPFDSAGYVLQIAIAITNDAASQFGIQGQVLNAEQPATFVLLGKCYRDLQDKLISSGVETFTDYLHIYRIPPANSPAIRTLVDINYYGYFNGQRGRNPNVKLPSNLIIPIELWESQSGTANTWIPMIQAADSISTRPPQPRFSIWDWTENKLILPQATQMNDLRIKAITYAPDLTGPNSVIYVAHAQTALANMLAAAAAKARGGIEMAAIFDADALAATNLIANRTAIKEEYANFTRRPFRGHRSGRSGRGGHAGG